MPKRVPTPPPADDEPRYLTVVHPYAISGTCNMELPRDRIDFANWVACCVDKDAFFAIFHKPSSRGMVIIELNRHYRHFDRILGEHRWSEFLLSPTEEDMGRITRVFYCTYNTGRIVQKNGWKRIDVDEAWFKAWSQRNGQIKFPYPAPQFCDVPVEDQTNHSLCRPLPGAVITPPPVEIVAPQPVVGSTEWIQKKTGGPSPSSIATQAKPNTLKAWGKGAPKAHITPPFVANTNPKRTTDAPQGPPAAVKKPAVGGGSIAVKSSNVWQSMGKKHVSPSVARNWEDSPPASREGTPSLPVRTPAVPPGLAVRKNAWASDTSSHPTLPPGLTLPSKASSATQGAPDRSTNLSVASWGSTAVSASSPDSDSGPDLTTATESDNPYAVHIRDFSGSMEEEFHGMNIREMDDDLLELDSIAPITQDGPMGDAAWENPPTWGDEPVDAEDLWRQNEQTVKPVLCNAHGIICKKGICAEYAKQLRLEKRAKEVEKRMADAANKGKKGGRSKGRGAAKKDDNENGEADRNQTKNNAFRGPGASVKTNWRGAPRAIVSADAIEKRETKDESDDGWGNSSSEHEPNAAMLDSADAASDASWGISEGAPNPWATPQPTPKVATSTNRPGGKPQGRKKPAQTNVSSNWADQVDAVLAAGHDDSFSVASSKRGGSTAGRTNSRTTKSSTSGWGSAANADMPW